MTWMAASVAAMTSSGAKYAPGETADGFVPLDPSSLDTVSGGGLLVACYCIITGVLMLYSLFTLLRERSLARKIAHLRKRIASFGQ
jgi:hypothetical protein